MRYILGKKQPYEEYYISFDFTKYLGITRIETAIISVVKASDNTVVTSTITDIDLQSIVNPYVYVWVRGGTSGETYYITCRVACEDGSKYELDASLSILES